jgi:hypothetical protein
MRARGIGLYLITNYNPRLCASLPDLWGVSVSVSGKQERKRGGLYIVDISPADYRLRYGTRKEGTARETNKVRYEFEHETR